MIERFIGPATIVYVLSASVACLWWAADLSRRVVTIEHSTVTAERLARLEAEVHALGQATHDMKESINDLSRAIRAR
jgi:uncharacterized protein YlxW (UPF0749 family)